MKHKFIETSNTVKLEVTLHEFMYLHFLSKEHANTLELWGAQIIGLDKHQEHMVKSISFDFTKAQVRLDGAIDDLLDKESCL
jgi:hypothetical protein